MIAKADPPSPISNDKPVFGPESEAIFQLLLGAIKREYKTENVYDVLSALVARNAVFGRENKVSIASYIDVKDGDHEVVRESTSYQPTVSVAMYLGILAFRSAGDLDKFIHDISALARVFGHKSEALKQLGVPTKPEPQQPKAQGG